MNDELQMRLQVVGPVLYLTATGYLDAANAYLLLEVVGSALCRLPATVLVIDVGLLRYIDTVGVQALRVCLLEARRRQIRMTLVGVTPLVRRTIVACDDEGTLFELVSVVRLRRHTRWLRHLPGTGSSLRPPGKPARR